MHHVCWVRRAKSHFLLALIPIQDRASQLGWHKADNSTETTHWYGPEETVINWHATDPTDQQNRIPSFHSGWISARRLNTFQPTSQAVSCCLACYIAWDCNKVVYRLSQGRLASAFSFHDPNARPAAYCAHQQRATASVKKCTSSVTCFEHFWKDYFVFKSDKSEQVTNTTNSALGSKCSHYSENVRAQKWGLCSCLMLEENLMMFSVRVSGMRYNQQTVTGRSSLIVDWVWVKRQLVCKKGLESWRASSDRATISRLKVCKYDQSVYCCIRGQGELIQEGRDGLWGRGTHQCFATESRPVHLPDRHTHT